MNKKNTQMTLDIIATSLGYSKTTVSRAISGKGRISADTQKKIWEYCLIHEYRTNDIIKAMNQFRTYNLAVILPTDPDLQEIPFFQNCLLGICETASERNYNIMLVTLKEKRLTGLKKIVEEKKVDGIILMRSLIHDTMTEYLIQQKIPFLVIGSVREHSVLYVDNDNTTACKDLTSYLLKKRIQRIALIGGNNKHTVTEKRLDGFYEGFQLYNKLPPPET